MPDFDPAQFVIGTSAWGSRIPVSRAVSVGAALVDAGFARFDSAPTYGSSYAHYALNRLADKTGVEITVDTKHGQLNERSLRGIGKKIFRAPSLGALASSFWQQPSRDRMSENFWATDRLMQVYLMSRRELNHAKIDVFYYHAPPMPVLGPEFSAFQDILASQGATLDIAEPMMEDLLWLRRHPERRMVV